MKRNASIDSASELKLEEEDDTDFIINQEVEGETAENPKVDLALRRKYHRSNSNQDLKQKPKKPQSFIDFNQTPEGMHELVETNMINIGVCCMAKKLKSKPM
jgi:hypothetical protein